MNLTFSRQSLVKLLTPVPYLGIFIFILITVLKITAYALEQKRIKGESRNVLITKLEENHLGFLIPIMEVIGVGQFYKTDGPDNPVPAVIVSVIALFILMYIVNIYYGNSGLLLILFICLLARPYLNFLSASSCSMSNSFYPSYCCGSVILWIFAAACINILMTNKSIYFGFIHIIIIISLILADYHLVFKAFGKPVCKSINHHASIYVMGFIASLLMLMNQNRIKTF